MHKITEEQGLENVIKVNCYLDKILIEFTGSGFGEKCKIIYFQKEEFNCVEDYKLYWNALAQALKMERLCCRYEIPDNFTYSEWNQMFNQWENRLRSQYSVSGFLIGTIGLTKT